VRFVNPTLEQILDFCAQEPIERVFLEDIARRGLGRFVALRGHGRLSAVCHVGANVIPAGEGCGAFAERAAGMRRAFAYRSIIF